MSQSMMAYCAEEQRIIKPARTCTAVPLRLQNVLVMHFEIKSNLTPKALANFSPRVGACDNLGITKSIVLLNPGRDRRLADAFSVLLLFLIGIPGLSLRSNPGLKLANAFGVAIPKSNCITARNH